MTHGSSQLLASSGQEATRDVADRTLEAVAAFGAEKTSSAPKVKPPALWMMDEPVV
jgi:hypothetical protein